MPAPISWGLTLCALCALVAGCPASTPAPAGDGDLGARDQRAGEAGRREARPPELAVCGNGRLDGSEECDGTELRGETCTSQGFTGGTLSCGPGCALDRSQCTNATAGHATLVYGTATALMVRTLDTATGAWTPPATIQVTDPARWVVNRISPVDPMDEVAAATTDGAGGRQLQLLRRSGGGFSVGTVQLLPVPSVELDKRVFDLAYEQLSGEALAVYSIDTPNPEYRTSAKGQWSAPKSVFATPPGAGKVRWVVLASRPASDEIALVYSDHDAATGRWKLYTATWNGSAFVAPTALLTSCGSCVGLGLPTQAFDAAYEGQSGDLLIVTGSGCCSCLGYEIRLANGTTGGGTNTACAEWTFQKLAAQRGGNGLALVGDHGSAVIWSGAFFYPAARLWPGSTSSGEITWSDVAWVGSQPVAIAVQRGWSAPSPPGGAGTIHWLRSSTGGSWLAPPPVAVAGMAAVERVQLEAYPKEDRVLAAIADDAKSLWVATYDLGKGWVLLNSKTPVAKSTLSTTSTRAFGIAITQ